jgi:hypothetical protein
MPHEHSHHELCMACIDSLQALVSAAKCVSLCKNCCEEGTLHMACCHEAITHVFQAMSCCLKCLENP